MNYNITLSELGCDIIINNSIVKIKDKVISIPVIIRSCEEGWIPAFDFWQTTTNEDDYYIDVTQNFRTKLKLYKQDEIDEKIGYYKNDTLIIKWKTLINEEDIENIHKTFNGKLRACNWQNRYCTYFNKGTGTPWLHSAILNSPEGYVIHHINNVSQDNRKLNLHILPKREHDSINHPLLNERKKMFANPKEYWQKRKELAINDFINQLALIISVDSQNNFIAEFAKENIDLVKEILQIARINLNLNKIKSVPSENRNLNPHLSNDYLDTYEIEKYIKKVAPFGDSNQMRLI